MANNIPIAFTFLALANTMIKMEDALPERVGVSVSPLYHHSTAQSNVSELVLELVPLATHTLVRVLYVPDDLLTACHKYFLYLYRYSSSVFSPKPKPKLYLMYWNCCWNYYHSSHSSAYCMFQTIRSRTYVLTIFCGRPGTFATQRLFSLRFSLLRRNVGTPESAALSCILI